MLSNNPVVYVIQTTAIVILVTAIFALLFLLPIPGFYRGYPVVDTKLEPELDLGSLVIARLDGYKVGDLLVVKNGDGARIGHLIGELDDKSLAVQLDGLESDAKLVKKDRIIGVALFAIPHLGWMAQSGIAVPVILFVIVGMIAFILFSNRGLGLKLPKVETQKGKHFC